MSGISGIWHLDGKPLSHQQVKAVADTILHRGASGTSHWVEGAVGLSASVLRVSTESLSEVQPVVHGSGCILVFDGRIDNRPELIAELSPAEGLLPSSPDSFLAMLAYLRFGKSFPAHIVGDFALAIFDSRNQQLLIARDTIGVRPLYFYRDAKLFAFGSEIKAILAHPGVKTRPNDAYLAITMMGGMPPADLSLTQFENIFSLPPAHYMVVTTDRVSQAQYWDFDLTKQIRYRSSEQYAEDFLQRFQQAVCRRLRSALPVAITVSGGLDSSSVFCVAQRLKQAGDLPCPDVWGITHSSEPGSPSDEDAFVKAIEGKYSVKIERVPVEYRSILEGIRASTRAFEAPLGDVQWYNNALLFAAARRCGARAMLSGHWGDQVLFQPAYLVDLCRSFQWKKLEHHLKELSKWVDIDPKWFRGYFVRDLVRQHIPRSLRPLLAQIRSRVQRPNKDQSWFTDNFRRLASRSFASYDFPKVNFSSVHARVMYNDVRAKYYVQAMEWHNKSAAAAGIEHVFPFLDRDLLWFLMRVPGEMLTEHGVHRGLLRAAMKGILPEEIRDRRSKANYSQMENETMKRQHPEVLGFFSSQSEVCKRGYVNPTVLKEELALGAGTKPGESCLMSWSISDLMAFEMWLQEFFVRAAA